MKHNLLLILLITFVTPALWSQCTNTNATSCQCANQGTTNCDLLPDIIPAKTLLLDTGAYGIIEYTYNDPTINRGRLRVSVSTPNIGHGPLEIQTDSTFVCGTDTITGIPPATCTNTGLPPKILVRQYIYHKNGNVMTKIKKPAGSMTYHPTHGHMHVDNWGTYTLRTSTSNPDPLTWPIVATGQKLAFCLMDFGTCQTFIGHCVDSNNTVLGNANFPNLGLGGAAYTCSNVKQGISSGYTDIYYQYLDGMYIQLDTNICNGDYWIVVQLDPLNYFTEENENNNVIAVPYTLKNQRPLPVINLTGNQNICLGNSVNLTAAGATTYTWSPASGLNKTTGTIVTASPTSTTTYTVIGSKIGAGCIDTNYVTVNLVTTANISVTGNNGICTGSSTTLTASGVNTYSWAPATGLNATNTAVVIASPSTTTTYTVTGTTLSGCTGTKTITVTVASNVNLTTTGNATICQGSFATMTASGASTYSWSPSTGLNATTGSSVNANPSSTTTYTVSGTNGGSCSGTKTITVTVNPVPIINFPALAASYFDTETTVPLLATPTGGNYFGTGVSGTNFSPYNAGAGGPYYISYSYTNAFGCQAAAVRNTSVNYTCTKATGVAASNITSTSALISWNNTSTGPKFRIRFKKSNTTTWSSKQTTGIPHKTSYNLTGLLPSTTYNVNLRPLCTNINTAVSSTITFTTAGSIAKINDVDESLDVVTLYPNPNKGTFNIVFEGNANTNGIINIIDLSGRSLKVLTVNILDGGNDIPLKLNDIAQGVYILQLEYANQIQKVKLVIE